MKHIPTALFIGGLLDGKRRKVSLYQKHIFIFDDSSSSRVFPCVREYLHVTTTPAGVRIFEVQPLRATTKFTVEVEHHPDTDPALAESVLSDLLKHIDGHTDAFTAGVDGARIVTS
jgi:hypothetical protein